MAANIHQLSTFLDYVEIGLSQVYEDTISAHPKLYSAWLDEVKAKEWIEDKIVLSGLGAMPEKTVGGNIETDLKITSSTVDFTLTPYALGVVLEYELVLWDKYDVFSDFTAELAKSAVDRHNIVAYAILNNSFSTSDSDYTIYNDEALCANAHTRLDGGTWKNRPDTDVSLSYLALQQGRTDMALLVNERGRYIKMAPRILICSETNRWIADTLVKTPLRPGTADNDISTVNDWGISVHSSPYLTNDNYFWLIGDKSEFKRGVNMATGTKPEYRQDYDRNTWNVIISSYCSFGVRVLHGQAIWGSTGS